MIASPEIRVSAAPYPGLRPFDTHEVDIFFGREVQTDTLLERLQRMRFLAVVGPSGCGKSSLVRAGMIAGLETGFLRDAGSRWRIAEMRPGDHPLAQLTESLLSETALGPELAEEANAAAFLQATLRRGPLGLVEIMRETPLDDGANLLILVDQFEEIFRFRREVDADEADAFVALLLASIQHETPIYVVITMRSDFLGDAALFSGLPELLNDSQFLTPRLTREQCQAAIEKPARVFGGSVEPALVNRLLNEMGSNPDWLPVLQHTLMRMWTRAKEDAARDLLSNGAPSRAEMAGEEAITLTLDDYKKVGTVGDALSNHCDEVYGELSKEQKRIAEIMFRRLAERGDGQRDTRHPTRLSEIAAVAGVAPGAVVAVANQFRGADRSFIAPHPSQPLMPDTILDISHESLIRQWKTLSRWVDEEEASAVMFQRLKQTALLWKSGYAALWRTPDLERALDWKETQKPTLEWATRYSERQDAKTSFAREMQIAEPDFVLAMRFLDESQRQREAELRREEEELERKKDEEVERRTLEEKNKRRDEQAKAAEIFRRLSVALGVVLLIAVLAALIAWQQRHAAVANAGIARRQERIAQANVKVAKRQTKIAENKEAEAKKQKNLAETNAKKALIAEKDAKKQTRVAAMSELRAKEQARLAGISEHQAQVQTAEAERQRQRADAAAANLRKAVIAERVARTTAQKQQKIAEKATKNAKDANLKLTTASKEVKQQIQKANRIAELLQGALDKAAKNARSSDGRYLMSVNRDGEAVLLYSITESGTWNEVPSWRTNVAKVTYFDVSPDRQFTVTGGINGEVELFNLKAEPGSEITPLHDEQGKAHSGTINKAIFSPDMKLIATGSDDHSARVWNVKDGTLVNKYDFGTPVNDISFQQRREGLFCIVSSSKGKSASFYVQPSKGTPP